MVSFVGSIVVLDDVHVMSAHEIDPMVSFVGSIVVLDDVYNVST